MVPKSDRQVGGEGGRGARMSHEFFMNPFLETQKGGRKGGERFKALGVFRERMKPNSRKELHTILFKTHSKHGQTLSLGKREERAHS